MFRTVYKMLINFICTY